LLLIAYTSCPLLGFDLETSVIEVKDLKRQIDHSSHYTVLSPPCNVCGSLKGKLFRVSKENTELKQEIAYLTSCLERTVVSEKMIDDDLSQVEESATKSIYKLGVAFQSVRIRVRRVLPSLFLALTTTRRRKQLNPQKLTTNLIQCHPSTPRKM
jgi:hypothetical protein